MTATNPYYQASGAPSVISRGTSTTLRDEFAAIQSGFDKISTTGRNWTGTHDFSGGTLKAATATFGASGNEVATLDFVNVVAMNTALPGQTGNLGKIITTNGTTASWTDKINASVMKLADGTDATKLAQFDLSGIATGTTRKIVVPDRDVTLGGFTNLLVVRSTQTWNPPAGVTKAKITVIDGGDGGATSNDGSSNHYNSGGKGGDASISVRTVSSAVTYTATVGAGGVAATPASPGSKPGGASSFSGSGFTTLTSANGDVAIPGGNPPPRYSANEPGDGGNSLYALRSNGSGIGRGGAGGFDGTNSGPGTAGAIIIEY